MSNLALWRTLAVASLLAVTVYLLLPSASWRNSQLRLLPVAASPGSDHTDQVVFASERHGAAVAQLRPKRVAIVGAGASGSSAAFFLRRAARVMEERIAVEEGTLVGDIVVFERNDYVGGRSTTVHPHGDPRTRAVELGASIFVAANQHMMKAAKLFNLTLVDPDFGDAGVGIWDGSQMLYTTSTTKNMFSGWWDSLTAVWRYGPLSPIRTNSAVGAMLKKFANLYDPKWLLLRGDVRSIEEFAEKAGLGSELTTMRGEEWALQVVGAGDKWIGEIMEGSTRVNYASDMSDIHALGSAVSMAASGAKAILDGNWRVFDGMLKNASAAVLLNTEVRDILPFEGDGGQRLFQINTNTTTASTAQPFDIVFFAAPWHLSPVSHGVTAEFMKGSIPPQAYVHLHVTLLATTVARPDPLFFGLPNTTVIPTTILTTNYTSRTTGTPEPDFQSISWHDETYPSSGEYVVKIFSLAPVSDNWLKRLLGGEEPTWLLRKEWDSYPALRPIESYAPVEPIPGMHYLAALEPWVSTMETQTLSGREAVARVVEDWWGLGMGECRGGQDAWDWTCQN